MINHIFRKDFVAFQEQVNIFMETIAGDMIQCLQENVENLTEARFRVVNRVRAGKVQRRKKISNVKGYRFQDGRLVRMSPQEKMKRIRGQRKAKIKRKAKMARSLQRRKVSIRRRSAL